MSKKTYLIDGTSSGLVGGDGDWNKEALYGTEFSDDDFDEDTGYLIVKGRKEALSEAKRLGKSHSPFALDDGDQYRISYQVLLCEDRGNGGEMLYRVGGYEKVIRG